MNIFIIIIIILTCSIGGIHVQDTPWNFIRSTLYKKHKCPQGLWAVINCSEVPISTRTHGLFSLCIRPACNPRPLSGGEGEEVHMLELRFLYTTDQLYVPEKLGQRTDVYKTSIKYKRLSWSTAVGQMMWWLHVASHKPILEASASYFLSLYPSLFTKFMNEVCRNTAF